MDRFLDKFTNLRQAILRLIVWKFKGFAMVLPSQVRLQADHIINKMIFFVLGRNNLPSHLIRFWVGW